MALSAPLRASGQDAPLDAWALRAHPGDSVALTAVRAFQRAWGEAWRQSEAARHPIRNEDAPGTHVDGVWLPQGAGPQRSDTRLYNTFCIDPQVGADVLRPAWRGRQLVSVHSRFGVCPSWFRGRVRIPGDERLALDNGLEAAERARMREERAQLIGVLVQALQSAPESDVIRGQLVRFAVDQADTATAHRAVAACADTAWWCAFLRGYIAASTHAIDAAERDFMHAVRLAPASVRCRLDDVRVLLEDARVLRNLPSDCLERAPHAGLWFWALADPLWSVPQNERRVEHYVRHALVLLRGSLEADERHSWVDSVGNDVRRKLILRYGWPSYHFWHGPRYDGERDGFTWNRSNKPYTTYEYLPGRQHLAPSAVALRDPFAWRSADQSIVAPPGGDGTNVNTPVWFSVEHFAPPYPLVQLPEGQTALLRRQAAIQLATATVLDARVLRRGPSQPIPSVQLFVAHTPDSIRLVATADGVAGTTAVLAADIAPRPAVIGIEVPGSGQRWPAGRTRFGITPPAALDVLAPGARAIADPVLLRVPGGDQPLPSVPDAALRWMLGTTTLVKPDRIGVYWETYGFTPDEAVEHAVWIQRVTRQNPLRRLGISLNIATDRNTPVAVSWTEARLGPTATDLGGPVRIIGRSLTLDVSSLPAGEYVLEVAATTRGAEPVRGQRRFVIQ